MAENMRPRTAIQYLIEDAIEQSLNQIAEDGGRALFEFRRHFLWHVDAGSAEKRAFVTISCIFTPCRMTFSIAETSVKWLKAISLCRSR